MSPRRAAAALLFSTLLWGVPDSVGAPPAEPPRDVPAPVQGRKAADIAEREKALKADEERLLALRKVVDEKIARYEKLLGQVEEREKRKQGESDAKVEQLVRLFESMPPEGAAARIAALDDGMAAAILARMKSRKASAVLSNMEPKRVAILARKMAGGVKNFPAE